MAAAAVSIGTGANAADLIWDANGADAPIGADGSGNWDLTNLNWYDPIAAANVAWDNGGDNALLGNSPGAFVGTATPENIDLAAAIQVNDLVFGRTSSGTNYNISDFGGGSLTLNGNVTKTVMGGQIVFSLFSSTLNLAAGNHTFALTDTGGDTAEMIVNGAVGGSGGITVDNGAAFEAWGTLAFTADNSYAGATVLTKGRLVINTAGGLGSTGAGTTIGANGTLAIGGASLNTNPGFDLAEPITITRSDYTSADVRYPNAFQSNVGQNSISGTITLNTPDARFAVNGDSTLTIAQNLTDGNAGPVQFGVSGGGNGALFLTGTNTFTNGVGLYGGTLAVSSDAQIGGATAPIRFLGGGSYLRIIGGFISDFGSHPVNTTSFSGGIDTPDAAQVFTINENLTGGSNINKRGLGTLRLNGTNSFTGANFNDAGTVEYNGTTGVAGLRARNGTTIINGTVTPTGTGTFSAFGVDGQENATLIVNGSYTHGVLAAGNANSGQDFNISDNGSAAGSLTPGTTGNLIVNANATLNVNGPFFMSKNNRTTANVTQAGGVVNANRTNALSFVMADGDGGLTAAGEPNQTNTATYTKTGGTLNVAGEMWVGNGRGGTATFSNSGGDVNVANWFVVGRAGAAGTFTMSAGNLTKTGPGNSIVDEGALAASTMVVSNDVNFNVLGGEFWIGQATGANGTFTIQDTADLVVNNWFAVGRDNGTGVFNLNGNATVTKGGTGDNNVVIGGFNPAGNGTFNQTGGTFTVTNGDVRLGEDGTGLYNMTGGTANVLNVNIGQRNAGTGTVTINGGSFTAQDIRVGFAGTGAATLNLTSGTLAVRSIVSGAGTGTKTFTFPTGTLSVGTFSLAGGLNNVGTGIVSPGGAGVVGTSNLTTGYTQGTDATLRIDLASAESFDNLVVTGAVALDGAIDLNLVGGYDPLRATVQTLIAAESVTGIFDSVIGIRPAANKALAVLYTPTSVTVQAALPGDISLDGTVGFNDLVTLAQNYNARGATWVRGDFNGDSLVGFADLVTLAQFYNQTAPFGTVPGASESFSADWALAQSLVPEPGSLALLGLAGVAFGRRRR